jgi:phage shock protein PspC (stress-responsive transcriptional regulator)
MNEITRIHIAKIPYDIEISAKHEIEKYFKELENYARDNELLQDIEIRITELLAVRGVESNGVIGSDDVEAIKKQLGEPRDFRSDESTEDFENNQSVSPKKKLYRDKESAILGGVLSGLANYFNIDPIWMRLGFVILFFPSGGSLLLLYILFWLIIPPARTAIEKIQMTGRTVNLDSIREFNEIEADQTDRYQRAEVTRRVISVIFGCVFLAMAVSTLMFTILAAFRISVDTQIVPMLQIGSGWAMLVAFVLSIIAGLLLSLLFAIISYSIFTRKFTRKISISISSIIALGIVSFASAAGIAMMNNGDVITNQFEKIQISVPENFSKINSVLRFIRGLKLA